MFLVVLMRFSFLQFGPTILQFMDYGVASYVSRPSAGRSGGEGGDLATNVGFANVH